ncbi:MAG: sortase B protein-sorting domain-containing protein [Muribaculum sp.]|nr:sortase B protein-sorting domain-containing protein [Ruminococcus flavefaciens]MCM1376405.1 sortase B protein-sorting domain-containing protein [Muribaculum sp.]
MKKRKNSLLQRMMAVLLSAVLVMSMVSNVAPLTVLAEEPEEAQESVSGNTVEIVEDTELAQEEKNAEVQETVSGNNIESAETELAEELQADELISTAALTAGDIESSTTWNNNDTVSNIKIIGGTESAPVVITVDGTVIVNGTLTISSGYVKFTGGGTLQWSSNYALNAIVIEEGANVTFENVTLDGNKNNKTFSRSALLIKGTAVFNGGTTVKDFSSNTTIGASAGYKGVIAVHGKGLLNIYDGVTITGNKSDSGIIALYQTDDGNYSSPSTATVNMYGGTIEGNTVNKSDMGVIWNWFGNLNISGGTVTAAGNEYAIHTQGNRNNYNADTTISGGTFTGMASGAVCAGKDSGNRSAITITGGIFNGKVAATVNYGTIDIKGGIYNGTDYALSSNGSGTLTVQGGEFFGNTKAYNGEIDTQTNKVVVGENKDSAANWDKQTSLNGYKYVMIGEIDESGKDTTVAHTHTLSYTASGVTITQTCSGCDLSATATLSTDKTEYPYTGNAITPATLTYSADWVGEKPGIAYENNTDPGTATAKLTIGSATAVLTFTIQAQTYVVSVTNGTGGGEYEAGATVTITADAPASGKQFGKWEINSGSVTLADAASSTTTFTMPAGAVSVTATYKDSHTHEYGDWQHDSTQHWKVCVCGEESDRANHGFGDWITDKEATATEAGTKHRECQTCGYSETGTIPAMGTEPGIGTVTPEVKPGANAPATSISTPTEELEDMLLTPDEKQQVQNGTNVKIVLEVQDAGSTVSTSDKSSIQQALNGYTVGQYLNIDLYKLVGENRIDITETAEKIRIVITIPDSLKNTNSNRTRTFAVIRVHDGRVELLPDLDNSAGTITIETDRFSTYAIVYKDSSNSGNGGDNGGGNSGGGDNSGDTGDNNGDNNGDNGSNGNDNQNNNDAGHDNGNSSNNNSNQNSDDNNGTKPDSPKDDEPKTGDATPIELYATLAMIAGFAYLLLYFADRKRGMTEETKKELVSRLVSWAKQGGKIRKCLALAAIFVLLVYYHSIGKKTCVEWKEIYGE